MISFFFIPDRRSAGTSSIPPASTAPGEPQRAVFHNSAAAAVLLSENLRHVCSIFRFRKNQPYLHSKGDRSVPGRSFPAAIAAVPTTIPCGLPAEWCRLEHFMPIALLVVPTARHSRLSAVSETWRVLMWDTAGNIAVTFPPNLPAKACHIVPSAFQSPFLSAAAAGHLKQLPFFAGTVPPVRKGHPVPAGAVLPMPLLPGAAR